MSLCAENLHYSYGDRPVLKGVSFTAEAGEFLSVLGPNGVGKSTLFRCILGLLTPTQGRTVIDGKDTSQMHPEELARRIAYIPQSHSPVFNYSVEDMRRLTMECLKWILTQDEVPATQPESCGNYLLHDLPMCKWESARYLDRLEHDFHCEYTKLQIKVNDDMIFADA